MFMFWLKSPLMEAAGDGTGSGGGTGSGSGSGGFDAAAFQTSLMTEVNKAINGAMKGLKTDFTKALEGLRPSGGSGEGAGSGSGSGEGAGAGSGGSGSGSGSGAQAVDPATAAELRALKRQNEELAKSFTTLKADADKVRADADAKELAATVRSKLSEYKFADKAAAEDAFEIFGSKIKRDEGGNFVGQDGTPIDQFLEEGLRAKPYLLAPKDAGGAGARNGRSQGGAKTLQLEDIKPGMKPEDVAAASDQIRVALAEALGNRA